MSNLLQKGLTPVFTATVSYFILKGTMGLDIAQKDEFAVREALVAGSSAATLGVIFLVGMAISKSPMSAYILGENSVLHGMIGALAGIALAASAVVNDNELCSEHLQLNELSSPEKIQNCQSLSLK